MTRSKGLTEAEAGRIASGKPSPYRDEYERGLEDWVARQIAKCPPLSEQQKAIIRTSFATLRTERTEAA